MSRDTARIDRRTFLSTLGVGVFGAPLKAKAQQPMRRYLLGYLSSGSPSSAPHLIPAFKQGLRELGWIEGQNIVTEYRFADGRFERLPNLAAELIKLNVDIFVAVATPTAEVVKKASSTIPIVGITLGDPVRLGLIA